MNVGRTNPLANTDRAASDAMRWDPSNNPNAASQSQSVQSRSGIDTLGADSYARSEGGLSPAAPAPSSSTEVAGAETSLPAAARQGAAAFARALVDGLAQSQSGLSPELERQWAATVSESGVGVQEVNGLVQEVLREAYLENTKDLRAYAEKVKFYNEVKKAIRQELQRARERMAGVAGKEGNPELMPPFEPTSVQTEFYGQSKVQTSEWTGKEGQAADAWFESEVRVSSEVTNRETIQVQQSDPVVLDLDGDGIEVSDSRGPVISETTEVEEVETRTGNEIVREEITTTRTHQFTQWASPDDGVLMADMNGDGTIQSTEFFGDDATTGSGAANGFEHLSQFDSNGDRVFNHADEAFAGARVWQDANQDGEVQNGELSTLYQAGVAEVGIDYEQTDDAILRQQGGFTSAEGLVTTKKDLENYIQKMEDKLNSVGEDAQLANVDLQNMMQKQQQTLQTLSNVSKSLHDTASSVIRKMS